MFYYIWCFDQNFKSYLVSYPSTSNPQFQTYPNDKIAMIGESSKFEASLSIF